MITKMAHGAGKEPLYPEGAKAILWCAFCLSLPFLGESAHIRDDLVLGASYPLGPSEIAVSDGLATKSLSQNPD